MNGLSMGSEAAFADYVHKLVDGTPIGRSRSTIIASDSCCRWTARVSSLWRR
jgi:hypothetical protein